MSCLNLQLSVTLNVYYTVKQVGHFILPVCGCFGIVQVVEHGFEVQAMGFGALWTVRFIERDTKMIYSFVMFVTRSFQSLGMIVGQEKISVVNKFH